MSYNKVQDYDFEKFPIDLKAYKPLALDPSKDKKLSAEQKAHLQANIQLLRDTIIFFTATGAARGAAGHSGGPYDTVPEVAILLSFLAGDKDGSKFYDTFFDEAGHRVATQYLLSALDGAIPVEQLLHYRAANSKLPGHPELGLTPGVKFSSGRLGHMWPLVNGVAMGNPDKVVFCLGSDGSEQEGDDSEAARLAVAKNLNVKLFIDDNNVTIAGHPSDYLKGYSVKTTLEGHGMKVLEVDGEDLDALYPAMVEAVTTHGPFAVVAKRKMAVGIPDLEGSPHAHDVIKVEPAIKYLDSKGHKKCAAILRAIKPTESSDILLGSTKERGAVRVQFGEAVSTVLDKSGKDENAKRVCVIDSDLEGSTGLSVIHKKHPEVFVSSGIMERGNFSAAAGFGAYNDYRQGVFSTFSAFSEMIISELTMARLNFANVLTHFSHSGVDEMADNTCHFGINQFFLDNGLEDSYETKLYFPADADQMDAIIDKVFYDKGIRFVFSTRAKVPWILKEDGSKFFSGDYKFVPGKDEVIRKGTAGYIVSYGDMLYRSLDAVERLKKEGVDVGLINKSTLNVVDEQIIKEIGSSPFVLVVESLNQRTGLGSKYGTWLLERDLHPRYGYMGTNKEGCGGLGEQIPYQGLAPGDILLKAKQLMK
ncbi:putative transketolase [Kockovaella imperatae]|uniref:Putative transketolase n=1 Tax=Kockovaella imperatae TaxID=4999 RepID=A0A1Y1UHI7_9TREE|nr:putative transketolase [Kockovaella imperatae]ORX36956.1 putative transketolase [Kockovaella imperatae]